MDELTVKRLLAESDDNQEDLPMRPIIDGELHLPLRIAAARAGESPTRFVNRLVREAIERDKDQAEQRTTAEAQESRGLVASGA